MEVSLGIALKVPLEIRPIFATKYSGNYPGVSPEVHLSTSGVSLEVLPQALLFRKFF